jgi:hypothetical protein
MGQIRMKYNGADKLDTDEFGNLIIKTPFNSIVDSGLFIYQSYRDFENQIDGKFEIYDNLEYGFSLVENYSKQKTLIIDPNIMLEYSTIIGGKNEDYGHEIDVDPYGNSYITGYTFSMDFPTNSGTYNKTMKGYFDIFVSKLNPNGSALVYSTYIGGDNYDLCYGLKVDSNGNAYITGTTNSSDFPITNGAFKNISDSSQLNTFIIKINPNGSTLVYSALAGGQSTDISCEIVIDSNGNSIIAGSTFSSDFPITNRSVDILYNGASDVFVLKLNSNGSSLIYSTFIGGTDDDKGFSITVDFNGNVYVTGQTRSFDFPTTSSVYNNSYTFCDAFVFKLNHDGSELIYSTYIGGNGFDNGFGIEVDSLGNAVVTGWTTAKDFPTTPNAFDITPNVKNDQMLDTFVFKLNETGSKLLFSTFFGSNGREEAYDIEIDHDGNIFITGVTICIDNFPLTEDALDKSFSGSNDVFLFKLSSNGTTLMYSTFLGGNDKEEYFATFMMYKHFYGPGIALDSRGNVYVTGTTNSTDFPTTIKAYDNTINGGGDAFVLKISFNPTFNITSLNLIKEQESIDVIYSKLNSYTFEINITNTISFSDLNSVYLTLDSSGSNLQLEWDHSTGQFSEIYDPYDYVSINESSRVYYYIHQCKLDFNITFNWTYPDEDFHDVQVYAISETLSPNWYNATEFYRVENDLVFDGTLTVKGIDNRSIKMNNLVRGGGRLNWTGLRPVYEGTTNVHPPNEEFNVSIWDDEGHSWDDTPKPGENFTIQTIIPRITDSDGKTYVINLSGIPQECDKTNQTFTIRIDGDNISFSNPIPVENIWYRLSEVRTGIIITDAGGGVVDGSSVMYSISNNNGTNWSEWQEIKNLGSSKILKLEKFISYEDGDNNLIKWRAKDSVGNGPTESDSYRVLVDTKNIIFSNPYPLATGESAFENVSVGITISDNTSGVNASMIMYSTSTNAGKTWGNWRAVKNLKDNSFINISVDLTFTNGTDNRLKWMAYDIAGNGPAESEEYTIIVNTSLQKLLPQVKLMAPRNGSIISTTSIDLSWTLINKNFPNVTYDVYFDNVPPIAPNFTGFTDTKFLIDNLNNGETYYWTIIPRMGDVIGFCYSGVWTFSVNTDVPYPSVNLIRPENGSIISSPLPTLIWLLEYEAFEKITYDIYLSPEKDPELVRSEWSNPYYMPEELLEYNTTYYWKVVPYAGNISGPSSEIWSFSIKKELTFRFGLNLTLPTPVIEMQLGSIKQLRAIVTNMGEITDGITLDVMVPPDSGVGAIVNEPNIININPNTNGEFNITITTAEVMELNEIELNVIASSGNALDNGFVLKKNATLIVKILREQEISRDESFDWIYVNFTVILIAIIVLVCIPLFYFFKNRSKDRPEMEEPQETLSEPQSEVQENVTDTSAVVGDQPITQEPAKPTKTPKAPTLASPTTPGQVPETPRISQAAEVPQLPPVPEEEDQQKTPSITPVSEVSEHEEQQKQSIPTIATTESLDEKITQSKTSTQSETQTKNTNQKTQQKD